MKAFITKATSLLVLYLLISCSQSDKTITGFTAPENTNRDRLFDSDWLFYRGASDQAEKLNFDDSKWRALNLPHDWSIEDVPASEDAEAVGPFSKKSPGTFNNGYFMTGELAAAGNGNPTEMQSFHQHKPTTFHGKCLAIVRSKGSKETVAMKTEADGLEGASVEINCK